MNRCDRCNNAGKYYVSGSNLNSYATSILCALCAVKLCEALGDKAGAAKFGFVAGLQSRFAIAALVNGSFADFRRTVRRLLG